MSFIKAGVCLYALAMAVASGASSYSVTFFEPSIIAGRELKPGDYRIDVDGQKVMIRAGKNTVEAAVKVENGDQKYPKTVVRYSMGDGKYHVDEIQVGGTRTKLVFVSGTGSN